MANILWIQPNQTLALTMLAIDNITPEDHAKELQERGDVPSDWVIAGYDVGFPSEYPHEAYRWVNNQIVVDETALAEIESKNSKPTVEDLQAQLANISSQLQALQGTK